MFSPLSFSLPDGPSSVNVEISPVTRAGSSVPLSLPVKTAGLTGIRIDLHTPLVAQVSDIGREGGNRGDGGWEERGQKRGRAGGRES